MAKRRKKTANGVPEKKRLRAIADELWSNAIRSDWGHRCAVCGSRSSLNAHHLVPRQYEATRYSMDCGCCLCQYCHQFHRDYSPHLNGVGFWHWLSDNHPLRAQWLKDNLRPKFTGQVNTPYLIAQIRRLREYVDEADYLRIVGVRFAAYLETMD